MTSEPVEPTCDECGKAAVLSTEARYEPLGYGSRFGCNECGRSFECKDGYYRCMEHQNDWCKSCFEEIKALKTKLQAVQIKCEDCDLPMVFSVDERYKSWGHGTRFGCNNCSNGYECKSGYYRCMKDTNDYCKDCFKQLQEEELDRQEYG